MVKKRGRENEEHLEKNERGLSTIVATLLIILLTLVAIGIIWMVVKNVMQSGSEQISLGKFTLDLEISQVQIINNSALNVKVKRNVGEGEFVGINFILENEKDTEVVKFNISLNELESRSFELNLNLINTSNITTISISPIFKLESGKEVSGDVKDEYMFSSSENEVPICTPNCSGKICGSNGCGGNCGNCYTGYTCNSSGQCALDSSPAWQTGMISWWKFDGDASDSVGANDGNVIGATLLSSGCVSGQCYSFDGINDIINLSNGIDASLNYSNQLTLLAWIYKKSTPVYDRVFERYVSSSDVVSIYTESSGRFAFQISLRGVGYTLQTSTSTISPNQWTLIGFTFNGTHVVSYYNGNFDGSIYRSSSITNVSLPTRANSKIGGMVSNQFFNGSIDEVMIWNRTLSASEVQEVYVYF